MIWRARQRCRALAPDDGRAIGLPIASDFNFGPAEVQKRPVARQNHGFPTSRIPNVNRPADRPPVLRFLALFAGLLAVALGLAAASDAAQAPPEAQGASAATAAQPAGPVTAR
jgi:hypothetical protein